jgi:hypothetical protein
VKTTLEKRDSEIYAALLAYQNGRYEKSLIALGELSGPLTALFFALSETDASGRIGAATNPDLSKAYITGTKDGLETALRVVNDTMDRMLSDYRGVQNFGSIRPSVNIARQRIALALSAETQKTQQAEDKQ